jgi:SAM-dependent methyltransferase
MSLMEKARNAFRAFLQIHGPRRIKKYVWNTEFARGKWNNLQDTPDDCVYSYIGKYSRKGDILDLACGSGNTGSELDVAAYQNYTGVDISDVAVSKAKTRAEFAGRTDKNHYSQSDIFSYVPTQQFDVILLRDCIYYIPLAKVAPMLDRYSNYLKKSGVFIVRMWSMSDKYKAFVDIIERVFDVVEKYSYGQPEMMVIIFRQRRDHLPTAR